MIKRVKDLLGMSSGEAHAAPTRFVTSPEPPRPESPKPPPHASQPTVSAPPAVAMAGQRQHADGETVPRSASVGHPADVFAQLDRALDELDHHLAASVASTASAHQAPPDREMAAAVSLPMLEPTSAAVGTEPPAFEIDAGWFGGSLAGTSAALGSPSGNSPIADTFHALLAAEQGAAVQPVSAGVAPSGISDEVIERIATRVAERLSEGVFIDTVRHVVETVAERLVRDEIARIRAKMNDQHR